MTLRPAPEVMLPLLSYVKVGWEAPLKVPVRGEMARDRAPADQRRSKQPISLTDLVTPALYIAPSLIHQVPVETVHSLGNAGHRGNNPSGHRQIGADVVQQGHLHQGSVPYSEHL